VLQFSHLLVSPGNLNGVLFRNPFATLCCIRLQKRFQVIVSFADAAILNAQIGSGWGRTRSQKGAAPTPRDANFVLIVAALLRHGERKKERPYMRRAGHIRERSPGSFELRYTLGTDPATGRRKVATATVRGTRKDAEKELRRLLRSLDTGEHVDPTRMTVRQWLRTWLAAVQQEVARRSYERYSSIAEHQLIPTLGALQITKLAPSHIQNLYNDLAHGGRQDGKAGPLHPQTRRQIHRVLSAALSRAVEQQIIARNPADVFKRRLPKIERREMTILSAEQSKQLLELLLNNRLYWPVMLALATGMRRGEVMALRWRNVDLDRRTIRVMESLEQTKGGLRFKPPKNGRGRTITVPAGAVEELRHRKREQAEELLKVGVRLSGATLVCARPDGELTSPAMLTNAFVDFMARRRGDLPHIRFHDLRHTHATQLLLAGVHPRIAQERLGHSTVALTLDLYSHVTPSMQEDAAAKIDAAFGVPSKPIR
jgi:integrase